MANKNATSGGGKDLGSVLKSKMAPPIAKCIVAYIPTLWLRENMHKLELGTPVAWIINLILPNSGFGQDMSEVSSDVLSTQIIEMAKDKVKDWENAKNKLQYERLQKGDKTPVTDNDYLELKKFLTFPDEEIDLSHMAGLPASTAEWLKRRLAFLKNLNWPAIKINDLGATEIEATITAAITKIDAIHAKPLTKESKFSRWIDRLTNKI